MQHMRNVCGEAELLFMNGQNGSPLSVSLALSAPPSGGIARENLLNVTLKFVNISAFHTVS